MSVHEWPFVSAHAVYGNYATARDPRAETRYDNFRRRAIRVKNVFREMAGTSNYDPHTFYAPEQRGRIFDGMDRGGTPVGFQIHVVQNHNDRWTNPTFNVERIRARYVGDVIDNADYRSTTLAKDLNLKDAFLRALQETGILEMAGPQIYGNEDSETNNLYGVFSIKRLMPGSARGNVFPLKWMPAFEQVWWGNDMLANTRTQLLVDLRRKSMFGYSQYSPYGRPRISTI